MQPSANIMPRAELQASAPNASCSRTLKPVAILPALKIFRSFRRPAPRRASSTSSNPSRSGAPHRVGELQRRGAGAPLAAVHGDEVGPLAGLDHRLDHREELTGITNAYLDTDGLPAAEFTKLGDKLDQASRG